MVTKTYVQITFGHKVVKAYIVGSKKDRLIPTQDQFDICTLLYCNLIWRTVARRVDEIIPSDHPRREAEASRVIRLYDLIHET